MLPPLKLKVPSKRVPSKRVWILSLGVILIIPLKGNSCSQEHDLSWVNELNHQTESLSKASQEAQTIVQSALEAASEAKNCSSAKELVRLGETGMRQTLMINSNPKRLSDSRVTETGVHNTRIEDAFPYPKLLVFVSFSMPTESLKILNTQVNRVGGKLVLRGLVNGSFQQTAQKLKELQIEVIIDPTLFEAYQIDRIPTFILRSAPTKSAEEEVPYDRLTGNVSLDYMLEKFSTDGETRLQAQEMLKTLRRKL